MARGLPGLWAGDPFRPHTWGNCEQLPYIREKLESPTGSGTAGASAEGEDPARGRGSDPARAWRWEATHRPRASKTRWDHTYWAAQSVQAGD
jgi:hypothetical protein